MLRNPLDLDVADPQTVSDVLRHAAEQYRQSNTELQSAWGDPTAGRIWSKLATILERAAKACDNAYDRDFGLRTTS